MSYEERAGQIGAEADAQIAGLVEAYELETAALEARVAELEQALEDCQTPTPPPPQPSVGVLRYSRSADRSNPLPLDGETIGETVYVFLDAPTLAEGPVEFRLNGELAQTENRVPWDFAGGSVDAANPWDTYGVATGEHRITAQTPEGDVTATFEVSNVVIPPLPVPPPSGDSPATPPNMASYPQVPGSAQVVDADAQAINRALEGASDGDVIAIRAGEVRGFSLTGKLRDGVTIMAADGPLTVRFDGAKSPDPFVMGSNTNGEGRGRIAARVKLLGLEISEYCWREWKHGSPAAVYSYFGANTDWEIGWCRIERSRTALLRWGNGWSVHDTVLSQSREFNMSGGGIPGKKTMERVIWEYCGGGWPDGTTGVNDSDRGGSKFAVSDNIHITDIEIRHSNWNGIWWDIASLGYGLDRKGHSLKRAYIHDTQKSGVDFEVMWGPLHLEDILLRNVAQQGKRKSEGAAWPVPSGVLISNSGPVYGKNIRIEGSYNGITCIQNNHPQVKAYDYPDGKKTKKYNLTREQAREMQAKYGIAGVVFEDCHVRDLKTTSETTYGEVPMAFGYAGSNHGYAAEADVEYIDCTYDSGKLGKGTMTRVRKV